MMFHVKQNMAFELCFFVSRETSRKFGISCVKGIYRGGLLKIVKEPK